MLILAGCMLGLSLMLMWFNGHMYGIEMCDKNQVEMLAQALEIGKRNGLAQCKAEYHQLIENRVRGAVEREANQARVEYLRMCSVREADARAEGVQDGWKQCHDTHQKRDGKGHFLKKGDYI